VLLAEAKKPDNPEDLVPRAPIVTIMGHVDHGKTSLLDRIRHSNVTATEAGGITQVIRAWRVEHDGKPITFLDTPGHEAFTKMRARGAHVTDIAVIVVAADDGVMPQTEEAINHAKASGVSIVVAINKIDLPNANLRKTEQQLYGLGLIPDNMGGEVPFVQTSAATGKGIDDLLETLSVVAELKELKANPNKPATGTCLEANLSEGEGVFATILVQDGTLRKGDVVVCGPSSGRVRAMYDDLGRHIDEAGPSVPVRITGLDEVPNADDPFAVVSELSIATEIAEKRMEKLREANVTRREAVRLEDISQVKIAELKVILKADFRGSIEAIRKELEKLHHEEVRVRVLHAAIGGITESDVQLALTSPQDTIIVGFNVVPDDRAMALAEERSVQMRQYNIIYKLTDDIARGDHPPWPGRGPRDIQDQSRRHHRRLLRHAGHPGAVGESARHPQRRRRLSAGGSHGRPRVAQAFQGRRARSARGVRVRHQGAWLRRHQGGRCHRGVPHRTGATNVELSRSRLSL
jgi:translation initiation factor IF-2